MRHAWEHPLFRDILLTETYVFDVEVHPGRATFTVDFVLATTHPLYAGAAPGEAFDYRRGRITFDDVLAFRWESAGGRLTVDPDGSSDWDTFDRVEWDGLRWDLRGQFGSITLTAGAVDAEFVQDSRNDD